MHPSNGYTPTTLASPLRSVFGSGPVLRDRQQSSTGDFPFYRQITDATSPTTFSSVQPYFRQQSNGASLDLRLPSEGSTSTPGTTTRPSCARHSIAVAADLNTRTHTHIHQGAGQGGSNQAPRAAAGGSAARTTRLLHHTPLLLDYMPSQNKGLNSYRCRRYSLVSTLWHWEGFNPLFRGACPTRHCCWFI